VRDAELRRFIVAQIDDLRAAIGQLGVDLGEAIARVEAKIAELGEPDADITADIQKIRDVSAALDDLVASPAPPEEPAP
jgi:ABC-type transporter Mla subunit MlaD